MEASPLRKDAAANEQLSPLFSPARNTRSAKKKRKDSAAALATKEMTSKELFPKRGGVNFKRGSSRFRVPTPEASPIVAAPQEEMSQPETPVVAASSSVMEPVEDETKSNNNQSSEIEKAKTLKEALKEAVQENPDVDAAMFMEPEDETNSKEESSQVEMATTSEEATPQEAAPEMPDDDAATLIEPIEDDTTSNSHQISIPKLQKVQTTLTLAEQDALVYGNLNSEFADALTREIEAAITESVNSLPLLDGNNFRGKSLTNLEDNETSKDKEEESDKTPKERLWDTLRYKFVRNVDVLEAYCAYHVLTLRKHPPARRKRIVSVLKDGFNVLPALETQEETPEVNQSYPTRSEIPSKEEQESLVKELELLKAEIEAAKEKRNALKVELESAKLAEQAASEVVTTLEENMPEDVHKDVFTKAEQSNTMGLLAEEAKTLIGKLDGIKRNRADDGEENFEFVQREDPLFKASNRMGNKRHKKPLTLEEAYRQDRRQLGLLRDSTNDDNNSSVVAPTMTALKAMLLPSSNDSKSSRSAVLPSTPKTPTNSTPGIMQ